MLGKCKYRFALGSNSADTFSSMMERYPNDKELHRITMQEIQKKSRDNARTPMQVSQHVHLPSGLLKKSDEVEHICARRLFNRYPMATRKRILPHHKRRISSWRQGQRIRILGIHPQTSQITHRCVRLWFVQTGRRWEPRSICLLKIL